MMAWTCWGTREGGFGSLLKVELARHLVSCWWRGKTPARACTCGSMLVPILQLGETGEGALFGGESLDPANSSEKLCSETLWRDQGRSTFGLYPALARTQAVVC